jgi:CheY-like chemotaxis protein
MDLNLPGMSGHELTKQLKAREKTRHIPIVALTASLLPEEITQALKAGCAGHIAKPIDTRDLPRQISQFLNYDSTGDSIRNK